MPPPVTVPSRHTSQLHVPCCHVGRCTSCRAAMRHVAPLWLSICRCWA
jgi:hypothetical protein